MERSRYPIFKKPHFITCTVVNSTPLFAKAELAQIILNSLSFLQHQQRLTLYSYVIMENQIHLIASAANLSKEIGNFKTLTARSIVDLLQENQSIELLNQLKCSKLKHKKHQEYQVWEEEFHPQAILNEEIFRQKLDYIQNNSVKHSYVDEGVYWCCSSYPNYLNQPGFFQVIRDLWKRADTCIPSSQAELGKLVVSGSSPSD